VARSQHIKDERSAISQHCHSSHIPNVLYYKGLDRLVSGYYRPMTRAKSLYLKDKIFFKGIF